MIQDPEKYDLWIKNAWVLSMDAEESEYPNGDILVKDGKIAFVGHLENQELIKAKEVMDASRNIVLPPFFNAHSHAPMALLRGLGNDLPLKSWLEDYIWPAEHRYISPETVYLGTLASGLEMIRSGCSIFADMYFFEEEVARAALDLGMRCILGEGVLDFPTPNMKTPAAGLNHSRELHRRFSQEPLLEQMIPAHAPYTCSQDVLQEIMYLARELDLPVSIHLSETRSEVEESIRKHGLSPVEYLKEIGFLDEKAICYHCNHLSSNDIDILRSTRTAVVTLPNSNMKLASGIAPLPELLEAGVLVGIGTDGAASNNNMSTLNDLQMLVKLQKVANSDPTVINARQALKIATRNGSLAYGLKHLGSVEVGKSADLQFINTDSAHMQPLYDPYAQIVYSMQNSDVEHLLIAGRFIMKNRIITSYDEERVKDQLKAFGKQLDVN